MSGRNSTSSGSIGYSKMNSRTTTNRNSREKYSFRSSIDLPDHHVVTSKATRLQQSSSPIFTELRRNFSVSSSSATTSGRFQSAVRRALSMRRSSSVSAESYSRINIHEDDDDDEHNHNHGDTDTTTPKASSSTFASNQEICSRGQGKILKACKRLFFGL